MLAVWILHFSTLSLLLIPALPYSCMAPGPLHKCCFPCSEAFVLFPVLFLNNCLAEPSQKKDILSVSLLRNVNLFMSVY